MTGRDPVDAANHHLIALQIEFTTPVTNVTTIVADEFSGMLGTVGLRHATDIQVRTAFDAGCHSAGRHLPIHGLDPTDLLSLCAGGEQQSDHQTNPCDAQALDN